jgi:3-dehydroquinate dehydratase-1
MKPAVKSPIRIRSLEFGGAKPLFCVPMVAADTAALVEQSRAAAALGPDLVEWRSDYFQDTTAEAIVEAARQVRGILRNEAIIFTLRVKGEGGAQELDPTLRHRLIEAALRSGCVDIVDLELASEPEFLDSLMKVAKENGVRVILAFHNFRCTPSNEDLLAKIAAMRAQGADIAKIAVMPQGPEDVLRLFQVTAAARKMYPELPLATMSMGGMGSISRVAGFLYGSDMAFAVAKEASAPGQIPLGDARKLAEMLIQYS